MKYVKHINDIKNYVLACVDLLGRISWTLFLCIFSFDFAVRKESSE